MEDRKTPGGPLAELAENLVGYDLLTRMVQPIGQAPYLRVTSQASAQFNEQITHDNGTYLFSWGDPVPGNSTAEVARSIARVLAVEPMPAR